MLSALVSLPRGASRNLLTKELRRLGVRVVEFSDATHAVEAFDLVIVGSDAAHMNPLRKLLGSKRTRPPVIMVQTSRSLHHATGYDKSMWCLHRPVQPCLIRALVGCVRERKRLSRSLASLKDAQGHTVDDLWFAVFERLKEIPKR